MFYRRGLNNIGQGFAVFEKPARNLRIPSLPVSMSTIEKDEGMFVYPTQKRREKEEMSLSEPSGKSRVSGIFQSPSFARELCTTCGLSGTGHINVTS